MRQYHDVSVEPDVVPVRFKAVCYVAHYGGFLHHDMSIYSVFADFALFCHSEVVSHCQGIPKSLKKNGQSLLALSFSSSSRFHLSFHSLDITEASLSTKSAVIIVSSVDVVCIGIIQFSPEAIGCSLSSCTTQSITGLLFSNSKSIKVSQTESDIACGLCDFCAETDGHSSFWNTPQ